ncbi:BofC C-terminal domain-containing protein [Anaerobacillus isosaccharinicus]|uniref:BofC C-terminal domain-containing protein n=2 Tax=Anaerobacillus isosaccharinicus TaxID=1532552 RepID=A0A7S7LCK2_9BACI|nr:intercompartmental signaling factor BofC [Anaerobacillus isosaccharinicus]
MAKNLVKKNLKVKLMGLFALLILLFSVGIYIQPQQSYKMATSLDNSLMRESINKGQIVIAAPVTATVQVVDPKTVRVILARIYLDGEISEEIVEETILSMEDFWAEYAEWDLIDQDEAQVVFQQRVDDISPLLKINGYFGISQEGTLNIYEGKPSEEKVIQSFFQINMKKLKSHQQQELEKGIPVISRDRYEEVLKMYKKYARHEM